MWGKGTTITAVTVVTEGTEIRRTILWILNAIRKTETDSYASKDKAMFVQTYFQLCLLGKAYFPAAKLERVWTGGTQVNERIC